MMDKITQCNITQCKTPKDRQHGFTLVELILSLTIVGFVIALLGGGFHIISKGWARAEEQTERQDMLVRGLAIIRRDIEGLERQFEAKGKLTEFLFSGSHDGLRFVVIEPPYPTRSGPYVVKYSMSRKGTNSVLARNRMRYRADVNEGVETSRENEVALLEGNYNYRFSFKGEVSKGGASSNHAWSDNWKRQDQLPMMIKFELREARDGTPVIPPFIIRLRHNAELGCTAENTSMCTLDARTKPQTSGRPGQGGGENKYE